MSSFDQNDLSSLEDESMEDSSLEKISLENRRLENEPKKNFSNDGQSLEGVKLNKLSPSDINLGESSNSKDGPRYRSLMFGFLATSIILCLIILFLTAVIIKKSNHYQQNMDGYLNTNFVEKDVKGTDDSKASSLV